MARHKFVTVFCISLVCFFGSVKVSYATIHLAHGHFANAHFGTDSCAGKSIGQACTGGALYAGTYNGSHYMTTPGNCTDYANNSTVFSPVCSGAVDTVLHKWANNSGTTANGVTTGASSQTDGKSNTTTLLSYTDTDAVRYCHYMNYGNYTDWYLPAASLADDANGELKNVLYTNRVALGGFQSSSYYWSSTDSLATDARSVFFATGIQTNLTKTIPIYVRCVRRY